MRQTLHTGTTGTKSSICIKKTKKKKNNFPWANISWWWLLKWENTFEKKYSFIMTKSTISIMKGRHDIGSLPFEVMYNRNIRMRRWNHTLQISTAIEGTKMRGFRSRFIGWQNRDTMSCKIDQSVGSNTPSLVIPLWVSSVPLNTYYLNILLSSRWRLIQLFLCKIHTSRNQYSQTMPDVT